MCGITGFCDSSHHRNRDELQAIVSRMTSTIQHRGPDDVGFWVEAETGMAFGHRRLSIIDLSPLGHQPMFSADTRYVIIFNGEIYNFKILRQELEGLRHTFCGHSDTEVMLAAFRQWGPLAAVKRFNGMFAFALCDRQARRLYLVRDRLGEKPMYYGWMGKTFLFGSELKALRAHPDFKAEVNREALALLMHYSYIPGPYSIYQGIYKLPAGTMLTVDMTNANGDHATPASYWSVREAAEKGVAESRHIDAADAIAHLDELLRDAVKLRMEADVPLGAFLSGGIDSATVVALMQAQSARPVKTFTIGFHETAYNEAENAKAVARHLGTEHTELYLTPAETMAVIPRLPALYDEPFSDSSQIPTFLVSELARRHVTVSLSGDGGDELFCGYNHYQAGREIWGKISWMPKSGRRALAGAISAAPIKILDRSFGWLASALNKYGRPGSVGDKLHKAAEVLAVESPEQLYQMLISHWKNPAAMIVGANEPATTLRDSIQLPNFLHRMMYLDAVTYLPDDILAKVDRASMGVSLEARVPLLDHRVVELAWQIPPAMNFCNGRGKWLLRQVLYKYVPEKLVERPKMGFGVPIDSWLRGALREWAEALLNEQRLSREGFFHPQPIRQKWLEHLSGQRNWQYYLWDVLMFQAWKEQWLPQ